MNDDLQRVLAKCAYGSKLPNYLIIDKEVNRMSGKGGYCVACRIYKEGLYMLDVERGWNNDKYQFSVEICEACLDQLVKSWKLEPSS